MNDGTLQISRTHFPVTALGPGKRLGIWVQGCSLSCRGCMSRDTWDPLGGRGVTADELTTIWQQAVDDGADGLTISGGEPLQQPAALGQFLAVAHAVRAACTDRNIDILVYTGYTEQEFDRAQWQAVAHADVLVTGRYDVARPTSLIWRGSANQRLVLRTGLGERRYSRFVDHVPDHTPMQVEMDESGVRFIGVPERGALGDLERTLRRMGLRVEGVTWRP